MSGRPLSALQRTRVRLPVRTKLATVSAALTFAILCLFAVVVGAVAEQKIRSNFDKDLRATAADLQEQLRRSVSGEQLIPQPLLSAAAAGGAAIRVYDAEGRLIARAGRRTSELGPPFFEGAQDSGDYAVVARPLFAESLGRSRGFSPFSQGGTGGVAGFVQYAKPRSTVNAAIARVRLFLALGVIGGTVLAFLAGLVVAGRAMRPISGLTKAAREVARTRDLAVTLPKPEAGDEVTDLANTLEDMLRELGVARSESEAALARQRDFVADASHELRTPLTSILANLELLEAELRGEQAEIAGSALRSSRRMRRLVADLLLLARADTGRQEPRRRVDLAAVAGEAMAEVAPLAAGHLLSIDAPDPIPVNGTDDDLHRLALNLIENALVHTPTGTPVTVAVRREAGLAVLEVADRGRGVPDELKERAFDRFSHGSGVEGSTGGSGLGLAIVRSVTESHAGSVEIADADGGGTRFTVRLPAAGEEVGEDEPSPQRERGPARPDSGA